MFREAFGPGFVEKGGGRKIRKIKAPHKPSVPRLRILWYDQGEGRLGHA
jgi:hypothetical protein